MLCQACLKPLLSELLTFNVYNQLQKFTGTVLYFLYKQMYSN